MYLFLVCFFFFFFLFPECSVLDTLVDPDSSHQLHSRAQSDDKTIILVDDMWHNLIQEDRNRTLLETVTTWLLDRLSDSDESQSARVHH